MNVSENVFIFVITFNLIISSIYSNIVFMLDGINEGFCRIDNVTRFTFSPLELQYKIVDKIGEKNQNLNSFHRHGYIANMWNKVFDRFETLSRLTIALDLIV